MHIGVIISIIPQTASYNIEKLAGCETSRWEIIRINCILPTDR